MDTTIRDSLIGYGEEALLVDWDKLVVHGEVVSYSGGKCWMSDLSVSEIVGRVVLSDGRDEVCCEMFCCHSSVVVCVLF